MEFRVFPPGTPMTDLSDSMSLSEELAPQSLLWDFFHGPDKENLDPAGLGGISVLTKLQSSGLDKPEPEQPLQAGRDASVDSRTLPSIEKKLYKMARSKSQGTLDNEKSLQDIQEFVQMKKLMFEDDLDQFPALEEEIAPTPKAKRTNFKITQKVEQRKQQKKPEAKTRSKSAPTVSVDSGYPLGLQAVKK